MNYSRDLLEEFLYSVDKTFPVPLSEKQNLREFADKVMQKGTVCAEVEDNRIVSAVIGYTDNLVNNMAYISVVATRSEVQGRGLASKLLKQFIEICSLKQISAVHLYAAPENTVAVRMYKKHGFVDLSNADELRPNDIHLVYYIGK